MNETEKRNYRLKRIAIAIGQGVISFVDHPFRNIFIIGSIWGFSYTVLADDMFPFIPFLSAVFLSLTALAVLGNFIMAAIFAERLSSAGFTNRFHEAPILTKKSHRAGQCYDYAFFSKGIPLTYWQDHKDRVENVLNLSIQMIQQGKNRQEIIVSAVSGSYQIPHRIFWKDSFMSVNPYALILGEAYGERVVWSLRRIPHGLIGGSSGSGKTNLLKMLLYQCAKKGFQTYIIDFKGGVDYNDKFWKDKTQLLTSFAEVDDNLSHIINVEMPKRKELLLETGAKNVDEYNALNIDEPISRIVIAIDEAAELLDKTGLDKEQKNIISVIEGKLATIARLARALNIHLIVATQRPDANIISGQIKNNLDYRLCGRADDVLSQIILDNTTAADEIPKDGQGLFVNHDGLLIKGYFLTI